MSSSTCRCRSRSAATQAPTKFSLKRGPHNSVILSFGNLTILSGGGEEITFSCCATPCPLLLRHRVALQFAAELAQ